MVTETDSNRGPHNTVSFIVTPGKIPNSSISILLLSYYFYIKHAVLQYNFICCIKLLNSGTVMHFLQQMSEICLLYFGSEADIRKANSLQETLGTSWKGTNLTNTIFLEKGSCSYTHLETFFFMHVRETDILCKWVFMN